MGSEKKLAEVIFGTEAAFLMNRSWFSRERGRVLFSSVILAGFVWSIALAASPELHARIHQDANKSEHSCAATLVASGSYHHSAPAPLLDSATLTHSVSVLSPLTPQWVESIFLGASTFEHAPPSRA